MGQKIKISSLTLLIGLTAGLFTGAAQAYVRPYTGQIYVSPGSSRVEKGNEFTVGVRINPGTAVDSVQTTLYYSTSALQFISSSPSAFPTCTVNSGGGGAVQLACTILGGSTSSDSLISNVTFKALAGSGSSALSLASAGTGSSNSNAARNGNWTNPSVSGGSVSFTSPVVSSPTSGGTSSGSSSSSYSGGYSTPTSSSPTPAKPKAPAPKLTLTVGSASTDLSSATVQATTNIAATVYAKYGTSQNSLTLSSAKTSGKTHTLTLKGLTPGTEYYFQVLATGSAGQIKNSGVESFTTKGFTVQVTVLDSSYHALANQKVTLHSTPMTATTNAKGIATFHNVAPGEHHLDYTFGGKTYSQPVYVSNTASSSSQTAPVQTAAVILTNFSQNIKPTSHFPLFWVILLAVLVYLVSWAVLLRKVLRNKILNLMKSRHPGTINPGLGTTIPHNFGGLIHPTGKK